MHDDYVAMLTVAMILTTAGRHKKIFGSRTHIHDFIRKPVLTAFLNILKKKPKLAARVRRMGRMGFCDALLTRCDK